MSAVLLQTVAIVLAAVSTALLGLAGWRWARSLWHRALEEAVEDKVRELKEHNRALHLANQQLTHASLTDSLTGLWNRRFVESYLAQEFVAIQDGARPGENPEGKREVMFLMLDLDRLKTINDRYGHELGDSVIQRAADTLREICRRSDLIIRWGGDEFLVIAHRINLAGAKALGDRLLESFRDPGFVADDGRKLSIGCSIGFCFFPFDLEEPRRLSWSETLSFADRALYIAKQGGRNSWAGILSGSTQAPPDLVSRVKDDFEEAVQEGLVEVCSSTAWDTPATHAMVF